MAVFLLLLFCLGFADSTCPDYWTSFRQSCYDFIRNPSSWTGAAEICREFSSKLIAVETVEENNFLISLIKKEQATGGDVWLGGNDLMSEGHWMWEDGTPMTWISGTPSNSGRGENCLEIDNANTWNDDDCAKQQYFICEKPEPTEPVIG